ncbi:MAG: glycosyltransferase family 4 protein [Bacteroidetes bacterium]|nr:MAG: glycosyltransferase family 4 protein [Bacteroidota bacterium]
MRTAIVHEWLPVYGGAERVLEQMLHVFPDAELYSLFEFLPDDQRAFLQGRTVHTSFVQRLPWARKAYRYYLPLMPLAIEQFDLTGFDVVLSQSYGVAKAVLTNGQQLHISYVCTPVRYAWDLYFQYLHEAGLERGLRASFVKLVLHYLRLYDVATANRVDHYLANSRYVARRIEKIYRRRAQVIYPPVDTEGFELQREKEDYYFTVSRMVPYKKIDLIVEAFRAMPDKKLVVIGEGPDFDKIARKAGPNVELMGYQPFDVVKRYMAHARALVFAAEEDFGIVPVEAQACGTPVLAFGRGGALETVLDGVTGLFFHEQSVPALMEAVQEMDRRHRTFDPERIRRHAEGFSADRFRAELGTYVSEQWDRFRREGRTVERDPIP